MLTAESCLRLDRVVGMTDEDHQSLTDMDDKNRIATGLAWHLCDGNLEQEVPREFAEWFFVAICVLLGYTQETIRRRAENIRAERLIGVNRN